MYDARTNLGNEVVEEVRKYFRESLRNDHSKKYSFIRST